MILFDHITGKYFYCTEESIEKYRKDIMDFYEKHRPRKSILEMQFNKAWGELCFQMKVYPFITDGEGWQRYISIDEEYAIFASDDPSFSVDRINRKYPYDYLGHLCLSEYANYELFKETYLAQYPDAI